MCLKPATVESSGKTIHRVGDNVGANFKEAVCPRGLSGVLLLYHFSLDEILSLGN